MDERRRAPEDCPHGPAAAVASHAAFDLLDDPRVVVLVEGVSDQIAVETLARRQGVDLASQHAVVVPTGGVHGLAASIRTARSRHPVVSFCGLYDIAEEAVVRRALIAEALGTPADPPERAGFFACSADLEDELIRACGAERVEACLQRHHDLHAFRRLQGQHAWRTRPVEAQLRRWIASGARRKLRYAQILVEAAPLDRMPRPLVALMARVAPPHP